MKHRGQQSGFARGGARTLTRPAQLSPVQQTLARGLEHHQAGRLADAEAAYRQVLAAEPANASALHLLGALANQCGQYEMAVTLISQAISIDPLDAMFHSNLGASYQSLERLEEATACYERALALQPNHIDALNNQGVVLATLGQVDAALKVFERSLKLSPNSHVALNNVGSLLWRQGRLEEAEQRLRRSLKLQPTYPEALIALAGVLQARGQLAEALAVCAQAVAAAPTDVRTHNVQGTVLRAVGRMDESVASYERAQALQPDSPIVWVNLAGALQVAGRTADAIAAYRRCLALDPDAVVAHSGLIFALDLTPGTALEGREERRRWNERFGQAWRQHPPTYTVSRDADRPLRVGYVSADFCNHSAAWTFMPILRSHDRETVQIYCYSSTVTHDAVTDEARALAHVWREAAFLTDDQLEAMIRADEIDVLVDLSGHTAGNRLPVFARKPAPVQMTAWGYATGTGMDAMDGFLADRIVAPPEEDGRYAEEIVPVPSTICFGPPADAPEVNILPALSRGYVTFGVFNRLPKITPESRETWARVLRALPTARLLIKTGVQDAASARQQLVDDLVAHGVERERIELRDRSTRLEHLAAHNEVDLVLDSFPHVGGVSTVEALLMGVPAITLFGDGVAGRLSASFQTVLGLSELVAHTTDEYVAIAQATAGRLAWLAEQRRTLRERLLTSPIGDTVAYTRAVEAAYREMWERWHRSDAGVPSPMPHDLASMPLGRSLSV